MFDYKCDLNGIGNRRLTNMDYSLIEYRLYVAFVVFDGHRGNSCVQMVLCIASIYLLTPFKPVLLSGLAQIVSGPASRLQAFYKPIAVPRKITCIYNTMLKLNSVSFCTAYIIILDFGKFTSCMTFGAHKLVHSELFLDYILILGPKLLRQNFFLVPQLSIRSGAHKLFRRFLDFSQFLTAIQRKLWRHLAANVRTMQRV